LGHDVFRHTAEFVIDKPEQSLRRLGIALPHCLNRSGDFAHVFIKPQPASGSSRKSKPFMAPVRFRSNWIFAHWVFAQAGPSPATLSALMELGEREVVVRPNGGLAGFCYSAGTDCRKLTEGVRIRRVPSHVRVKASTPSRMQSKTTTKNQVLAT
jgi:hypothetical protein